ncbi:MAG: hypothetical protein M3P26_13710 [Gemmatimonadota bacterium]|nr:hypothetical protein [Gemmatimonadota bacterium]
MPDPSPPRAPSIEPRLELSWKQRIGLPILLAVPILALFGVFGESQDHARATSASLDMTVSYPSRFRYRQVQSLHVTVRNLSPVVADTVAVAFDTAYISQFSSVRFDPAPKSAYTVDLVNVKPSESRLVSVELWGQVYGNHRGTIVARHGTDTVIVHLRTLVFP